MAVQSTVELGLLWHKTLFSLLNQMPIACYTICCGIEVVQRHVFPGAAQGLEHVWSFIREHLCLSLPCENQD